MGESPGTENEQTKRGGEEASWFDMRSAAFSCRWWSWERRVGRRELRSNAAANRESHLRQRYRDRRIRVGFGVHWRRAIAASRSPLWTSDSILRKAMVVCNYVVVWRRDRSSVKGANDGLLRRQSVVCRVGIASSCARTRPLQGVSILNPA